MDGATAALKRKLADLLREAAEVSVALDRAEGTIVGVSHYSVIEARAHELGRQLSQQIQSQHMQEIAVREGDTARCPGCGARCETILKKRRVTSIDGRLTVAERVAKCPNCRRDFFPPA